MSRIKKILFAILIVLIGIQFIQPVPISSGQVLQTDFSNTYTVRGNVFVLFKNACYDCHSNNTKYPWYSKIQPIGWLLQDDIKKGKEKLNFSEFGSYSSRRRISKLRDIEKRIKDGKMPLKSYKLMHKNAQLFDEDKKLLVDWIENTIDSTQKR